MQLCLVNIMRNSLPFLRSAIAIVVVVVVAAVAVFVIFVVVTCLVAVSYYPSNPYLNCYVHVVSMAWCLFHSLLSSLSPIADDQPWRCWNWC